jgi:acyl-CoA reductase-like NAD-dependent aldehyde dehydrogenase
MDTAQSTIATLSARLSGLIAAALDKRTRPAIDARPEGQAIGPHLLEGVTPDMRPMRLVKRCLG